MIGVAFTIDEINMRFKGQYMDKKGLHKKKNVTD